MIFLKSRLFSIFNVSYVNTLYAGIYSNHYKCELLLAPVPLESPKGIQASVIFLWPEYQLPAHQLECHFRLDIT